MYYLLAVIIFCCNVLTGSPLPGPFLFKAGPEAYHLRRAREGGTTQDGWITGVRVGFDRIKRYKLYLGGDYLYSSGSLRGATATGRTLTSILTDEILEGRVGYTFQQKNNRGPFITPFVGYGHFYEENEFYSPSPIPCKFTDTFHYAALGFLSGVNFTPLLSMGINFKLRFMQGGQSKVSEDPIYDTVFLKMQEEIQVRLDVPFMLSPYTTRYGFGLLVSPFYEYRHFGGREGFPFNYKDTKFYLYGAHFALTYRF